MPTRSSEPCSSKEQVHAPKQPRKWHISGDPDDLPESAIDRADAINGLYQRYGRIDFTALRLVLAMLFGAVLLLPVVGIEIPNAVLGIGCLVVALVLVSTLGDLERALRYLKPYVDQDPELKNGFDVLAGRAKHPRQVPPDEVR